MRNRIPQHDAVAATSASKNRETAAARGFQLTHLQFMPRIASIKRKVTL